MQEFDDYAPSVLGENAIIGLQKILETKYSTHIGKIRKNVILDNNELAADIKELLTGIYGEETTEFIQSAINRYLTENETTPEEYDEKLKEYNKKKELNKSIEERYLVEKGDNEKQKIYKKQYKKFDPRYTERLVKPNQYPAVVIRWELDISCVLNEKPLITEKDFNAVFKSESNLADIYRKQTNKIFDIFGSTLSVIQK